MIKRRLRQNIRRYVDHLMRRSGEEFTAKQKKLVYAVVEQCVMNIRENEDKKKS